MKGRYLDESQVLFFKPKIIKIYFYKVHELKSNQNKVSSEVKLLSVTVPKSIKISSFIM